jgi:N-acetylglucosamine kinase-like BadF-type ATPase
VSDSSKLIIAVDGGGSKTKAIVGLVDGPLDPRDSCKLEKMSAAIIGEGVSGPGNPRAVGFEVAQENIGRAIDEALSRSQRVAVDPTAVCLSLAGVGRNEDKARMEAWARSRFNASLVLVTTDAEPLLSVLSSQLLAGEAAGRRGDRPEVATEDATLVGRDLTFSVRDQGVGIALISGTGSYCFGRNAVGLRADSGGWGGLLGDEGGGYWIAMEGLRAVTRQADGRGESTLLTNAAMEFFNLPGPSGLIGLIYDPDTTRDQIAKFSGVIFDLAQRDNAAMKIAKGAAESLAELIATVARKLETQAGYRLGLTGGNLCNQAMLRDMTLASLFARGHREIDVLEIREPALGGISLAVRGLLA